VQMWRIPPPVRGDPPTGPLPGTAQGVSLPAIGIPELGEEMLNVEGDSRRSGPRCSASARCTILSLGDARPTNPSPTQPPTTPSCSYDCSDTRRYRETQTRHRRRSLISMVRHIVAFADSILLAHAQGDPPQGSQPDPVLLRGNPRTIVGSADHRALRHALVVAFFRGCERVIPMR
jgi:hypothetical protein